MDNLTDILRNLDYIVLNIAPEPTKTYSLRGIFTPEKVILNLHSGKANLDFIVRGEDVYLGDLGIEREIEDLEIKKNLLNLCYLLYNLGIEIKENINWYPKIFKPGKLEDFIFFRRTIRGLKKYIKHDLTESDIENKIFSIIVYREKGRRRDEVIREVVYLYDYRLMILNLSKGIYFIGRIEKVKKKEKLILYM